MPVNGFDIGNKMQMNEMYKNIKRIKNENYNFACLTITTLDALGHAYGPDSKIIKDAVEKIDTIIYNIWLLLLEDYEKVTIIAHGDHGMVEIARTVNMWEKLQNLSVRTEKDYVVFLDSPMARFWFFNEGAEKEIRKLLEKLDCGRILTEEDYEKYRIRFKDNKYGDLIWLANPGTLIFPNFFGWYNPVKGMHGYAPECDGNKGLFTIITNKELKFKETNDIKMIDMLPVISDIMQVAIPEECEGVSIVEG
jgi:predicted AlkP superfamily pyrophosphatase or phosphodiesterase